MFSKEWDSSSETFSGNTSMPPEGVIGAMLGVCYAKL